MQNYLLIKRLFNLIFIYLPSNTSIFPYEQSLRHINNKRVKLNTILQGIVVRNDVNIIKKATFRSIVSVKY